MCGGSSGAWTEPRKNERFCSCCAPGLAWGPAHSGHWAGINLSSPNGGDFIPCSSAYSPSVLRVKALTCRVECMPWSSGSPAFCFINRSNGPREAKKGPHGQMSAATHLRSLSCPHAVLLGFEHLCRMERTET